MWWVYAILVVYVLTCVVLITAVLLQPGKADAAALFGGGASQTAFGPRGAQNVLGWTTWVTAAIMILLALILSLPGMFGPQSVVQGGATVPVEQPAPSSATPPSTPTPAPAATPDAQQTAPAESKPAGSSETAKPESAPAPSTQPAPSSPQQ